MSSFWNTLRNHSLLLPAGIFFVALAYILARAQPGFVQDEDRYVEYAHNLLRGFYAPADTHYLWNGPGYPLFLAPFAFFGLPLLAAKVCNAFFLAGAAYWQFSALRLYLPRRTAFWMTAVFSAYAGLYGLAWLPLLMTEPIGYFLVSGGAYFLCLSTFHPGKISYPIFAALCFGILALTKVFFGYVLVAGLALCLGFRWLHRSRAPAVGAWIFAGALICCLPYLLYTYALTGRVFYWANSGGSALYSLSAPEPHLLGDIFPMNWVVNHPDVFPSQSGFLRSIEHLNHPDHDAELRREARKNFARYPAKAIRNWRANVNRLIMDFPYSTFPGSHSRLQTGNWSFVYAPAFFLFLCILAATMLRWRSLPPEIAVLAGFFCVSVAGLSLVSSYARFVYPLLPLLLLWLGAVWAKMARLRLVPP